MFYELKNLRGLLAHCENYGVYLTVVLDYIAYVMPEGVTVTVSLPDLEVEAPSHCIKYLRYLDGFDAEDLDLLVGMAY